MERRSQFVVAVLVVASFLLLGSAVAVGFLPHDGPSSEVSVLRGYRSVVSRVVATGCGAQTTGTATTIRHGGKKLVVTNRHVVDEASFIQLNDLDAKATEVYVHPDRDLARLQASAAGSSALKLAEGVSVGEPVVMAGFGQSEFATITTTVQVVTNGQPYGYDHPVLLIAQPVAPGFSGGAVINENFELVGLVVAVDQVTNLAIALPVGEVVKGLSGLESEPNDPGC